MEKSYDITEPDMQDYLDSWERRDQDNSQAKTRSRTRESFRKFCRYLDEDLEKHYTEVTEDEMEEWIDVLLDKGISHLAVKGIFSATRVFLQKQDIEVADDIILNDELGDKTLAEIALDNNIHHLEIDQHKEMLAACDSLREELIIQTLWATGVRRSELASIRRKHVDQDDRKIWIDNAKNDDDRYVWYGPRLARLLRQWDDYGRQQYAYADKSDYLICTSHSAKIADKYPNEVVKRVAERAGLLTVYETDAAGRDLHHPTAHSYRHSYAVHRVKNEMNLKILSDLMGHKSVETTADTYLNFKPKDLREANERHRPKL